MGAQGFRVDRIGVEYDAPRATGFVEYRASEVHDTARVQRKRRPQKPLGEGDAYDHHAVHFSLHGGGLTLR